MMPPDFLLSDWKIHVSSKLHQQKVNKSGLEQHGVQCENVLFIYLKMKKGDQNKQYSFIIQAFIR